MMDMNTPTAGLEGQSVPCVHLYAMPDGSYKVDKSEGPVPEGAQDAPSLDEAMELVRQMAGGGSGEPDSDSDDMAAAQTGYAKRSQPQTSAPNPGGVFGE